MGAGGGEGQPETKQGKQYTSKQTIPILGASPPPPPKERGQEGAGGGRNHVKTHLRTPQGVAASFPLTIRHPVITATRHTRTRHPLLSVLKQEVYHVTSL